MKPMAIIAITLYVLGVADFLMLAKSFGMKVTAPATLIRAFTWPARSAWLVIDELLPKED